jgi:hypothetical protein
MRYTLALTWVRHHEASPVVLRRLLTRLRQLGLRIQVLLLGTRPAIRAVGRVILFLESAAARALATIRRLSCYHPHAHAGLLSYSCPGRNRS